MKNTFALLAAFWAAVSCAAAQAATPPPRGYSIPLIDLAAETNRQVIVDREAGQYLGHPTTVLLEDGRTLLCVYPKGHGRGQVLYQRSADGGRTWSGRLPVPENWSTSKETPTIHRVVDGSGKKRFIVWSGLHPARLAVSEDDGATWSPLRDAGQWGGIVVMGFVEPLKTPGHYLAMFHDDGRFFTAQPKPTKPVIFTLYQTYSKDGGLNWSAPETVWSGTNLHLCEPGCIRSPDGKELAVLLRENSRRKNSHVIFSRDEGRTWTAPRELAGALTGDRHTGKYAPDGRLFISFRDTTLESPTKGDWVAWVGTYEDIAQGREGQYRVRLMDNQDAWDCAYPGVEVLPDGTFVTTTYGHWTAGEEPYIASVRLKLSELDERAAKRPAEAEPVERTVVFASGTDGYNTFRIPAIVTTKSGDLLAFAEGRKAGVGDAGDIDLVLRRSKDQGKTWSPLQVIWNDTNHTCGNPCPVVDRETGAIWLLTTWNRGEDHESHIIAQTSKDTRRVFVIGSTDDGRTWTQPRELTAAVKQTNWTWYATGPGAGIQMEQGLHKGRLVIPCDHIETGTKAYYSHVIYSDDRGQTWKLGGSSPKDQVNECEVMELSGGRLLLNMRNYDRTQRTRQSALSRDGGLTWTDQSHVADLIEPICQASIRRLVSPTVGGRDLLLFSNPASTRRERMTVKLSSDEGQTWPKARVLHAGPAAYSCLVVLPNQTIGCLYEAGDKNPYQTITFARFPLAWLAAEK